VRTKRAIGVDVGGTKILAGLMDPDGSVVARELRPTPVESQNALLDGLDAAIDALLSDEVGAVGFGIPSTIDQRTGRAVSSVNIPLADLDVRGRMSRRFGLPVSIDNDGNAAAFAEWSLGAGQGTTDMVLLTLGTGIGGGLVLGGRLFRGWIGAGAELGHIVVEHDGPRCQGSCTGRGHLEAVASGHAADKEARRILGPDADARSLVEAAAGGHAAAAESLHELGRRLGSGIGSLVNIFNPELVVVGGGFGAAGEVLLAPAREVVAREALPPARDLVRIVQAELGPDAGMIGAGLLAFEELRRNGS